MRISQAKKQAKICRNATTKAVSWMPWRFYVVSGLLLLAMLSLLCRTAWLQVIRPDRLLQESDRRSLRWQTLQHPRGIIRDRMGNPLAVSVPVQAIWADPRGILQSGSLQQDQQRWQALADVLHKPIDQLIGRIQANPQGRFIYLSRQISPTVATYIQALSIPGIYLKTEARRFYPAAEIAAHLVGQTNIDDIGIEGAECQYQRQLTGQPSHRLVRQDRLGRIIEDVQASESLPVHDVNLSIDGRLQRLAYRALKEAVTANKAQAGSAVLLDIDTGEILAMVNSPSYNPNCRSKTPHAYRRNRAITDTFEPGSTVKPLVLLAALENRIITRNSIIDTTPGTLRVKNHLVRDHRNYGLLNLEGVLKKSSNVAVSKLSLAMPIQDLIERYQRFGLGVSTQVGLIGEHSGMILEKEKWSDIERVCFSFGYGLAVTPLQIARTYATLGSFGLLRPVTFTKMAKPVPGERVAPEALVRQVVSLMEHVATPDGVGRRAAVAGYRVAVKTGTSRIAENGGYSRRYVSYTAGVAPASQPRLALAVVIHDPINGQYYGGAVAAPLFSHIMHHALRILNIEPDAMPITELPLWQYQSQGQGQ